MYNCAQLTYIDSKENSKGIVNMSGIVWETVDVKQTSRRTGEAYASIGQGRIALNADACDLIDNIYNYEWVDIIQGKLGNKVMKIGLRFTNNKSINSLHITRRKYKGKNVDGININSKLLVKKYFGETKENVTSRYLVERVDETTLAIDILNEI